MFDNIQGRLLKAVFNHFGQRFLSATEDATPIQQNVLRNILAANAATVWGTLHNFEKITTVRQFQETVPITNYHNITPLIERSMEGEKGLLTIDPIHYFLLTSGTTGRQKLIPFPRAAQKKVWAALLAQRDFLTKWAQEQGIHRGKGIMLISPTSGRTSGGIPYGPVSAGLARKTHRFWNWFSIAPFEASCLSSSLARHYIHWRYALLQEDLSYISAPFISPLLTFAQSLFKYSEELIRDVADGTVKTGLDMSRAERRVLTAGLRPNLLRAKALDRAAAQTGGLLPCAIWPHLGWIHTAIGPTFKSYELQLRYLYGNKPAWGVPYIASEGVIGVPLYPNSYSHIPALAATFLEFVPQEYISDQQPPTLLLTELEVGGRYEIIVTSWSGMYRYRVGDVIEVDGKFNGVPTFQVMSRTQSLLSVYWERTTEAQVVASVKGCEEEIGISIADFVVHLDHSTIPARYVLIMEPHSTQERLNTSLIEATFDIQLGHVNPIYSKLRDAGEINPPLVTIVPQGSFEHFHRFREGEGTSAEQLKVLHAITDLSHVDALLHGKIY